MVRISEAIGRNSLFDGKFCVGMQLEILCPYRGPLGSKDDFHKENRPPFLCSPGCYTYPSGIIDVNNGSSGGEDLFHEGQTMILCRPPRKQSKTVFSQIA